MAALNPTSGVFPPKESLTSPVTPRRTGLGSNSVVRRGKSKFLLPEFGVDLKELATSRYNAVRGIPFVLFDCLNFLVEEKGIHCRTHAHALERALLTWAGQERWITCGCSPPA